MKTRPLPRDVLVAFFGYNVLMSVLVTGIILTAVSGPLVLGVLFVALTFQPLCIHMCLELWHGSDLVVSLSYRDRGWE